MGQGVAESPLLSRAGRHTIDVRSEGWADRRGAPGRGIPVARSGWASMSWSDTLLGKAVAWLAAALVPLQTLPAGACGCARDRAPADSTADFRSLQDFGSLGTSPQEPARAAGCPHCTPRPAPAHSCCQVKAKAGCCGADRAKCGCCGGGSGCAGGVVCSCGQSHRHDPQLPPAGDSLKAKDLAGPAVVAAAVAGDHHAYLLIACHPWQFSSLALTPLERLSTLCRFLI